MKKLFMLLLCCIGSLHPQPKVMQCKIKDKLTLQEAVEQALMRKPSIHAYEYAIKAQERARKVAFTSHMPNITVSNTTYNIRNTYSGVKNNLSLDVSQPIFNLPIISAYREQSSYLASAKHSKEAHKDYTQLLTEDAFLNCYLAQNKFKLIKLLYLAAKDNLERAKKSYNLKLINKSEYLAAKSRFAESNTQVRMYKHELHEVEKNIEYFVGQPIKLLCYKNCIIKQDNKTRTDIRFNPKELVTQEPFDYYYQQALKHRKDIKIKDATIEAKTYASRSYAQRYLPTVSVSGNFARYAYMTDRSPKDTTNRTIGLSVSWNVFDGLTNYFNKSAVDAQKMQTILEKNDLVNKIKVEIQTAYTSLKRTRKNLKTQIEVYAEAKSLFTLRKKQYEQKLLSRTDFQNAQYELEHARYLWLTAAKNAFISHQDLLYQCGYPPENCLNNNNLKKNKKSCNL